MAEPTPQVIIDNAMESEWNYATELNDQSYLQLLLQQAQQMEAGTLSPEGVERARDPFSATPELLQSVDPTATPEALQAAETAAFPTGRTGKPTPAEADTPAGIEEAAIEAGTFFSPEYRIQQRMLEQGLVDAEVNAFRSLFQAYQAEGDSPTVAMRKARQEISIITGAYYTPSGQMTPAEPTTKGEFPFPTQPEERGAFEKQLVESPSQVEARSKARKAGEEEYQRLKGSFNLEAYDIVFDENDQRRPVEEIERRQREARLPVNANIDFDTMSQQLEDRFKAEDLGVVVKQALDYQLKAQGKPIPKRGEPDYGDYTRAQVAMSDHFIAQVFQEEMGQTIDPRKATLTDRFVKDLFTEKKADGSVQESSTAAGLRIAGGLIRPVSNLIVGGMTYEVDEEGNVVDEDDINYKLSEMVGELVDDDSVLGYIGYLTPAQPIVRKEGARESGYVSHDTFLDATLHDIKVGRFLGDDFVSMPFLAEGLGEYLNTDGEAAAMSLGLITEIGLPLTPAGAVGMSVKGVGMGTGAIGKATKVVTRGKKGQKLSETGASIDKAGEALLPENLLQTSTNYYRFKQLERAKSETGMQGTLSISEGAAPRMARDFDYSVTDDAGKFSKEKYDKLKATTPDGERAISEAASIHQEIDDLARNIDNISDEELSAFLARNETGAKVQQPQGVSTASFEPISVDDFRVLLSEPQAGVPALKTSFTYETFQTFLANKVPKEFIFVTPTMVAKTSAYRQVYQDVQQQMTNLFSKFKKVDGGVRFTGSADEMAAMEEVVRLRGLNIDPEFVLTPVQVGKLNDVMKEVAIEQTLLARGEGGKIGYVSDQAYAKLNIPEARRYQGTITSQALSPIALSGMTGLAVAGPAGALVGLAAVPMVKLLSNIPVAGKAAKVVDNIITGVSKYAIDAAEAGQNATRTVGGRVGSYFFGKPKITETMPIEMKRLLEGVKGEVRAIPRNLVMEMSEEIKNGVDPVVVFESKLAQAITDNPRYDIVIAGQKLADPIQGDDLFSIDFIRGFFGDDIKFLTDEEILRFGFGGSVTITDAPLATMRSGIGKLRSRFTQLENRGFGGKFMGDDFASYSTLFILESRAKAVLDSRLTNALQEDAFLQQTMATRKVGVEATVEETRALDVEAFGREFVGEVDRSAAIVARVKADMKAGTTNILGPDGQPIGPAVAPQLTVVEQAQLQGVVGRFQRVVEGNANAITKGYFNGKKEAMLQAGLDEMVEAVIRGDDYYTIIRNYEDNVIRTLVSDTLVSDVKALSDKLADVPSVKEALKLLGEDQNVDGIIRGALIDALKVEDFSLQGQAFLSALERNGMVVNKTTFGKESVKALQPNIVALGDSGYIMIGNKGVRQAYDDLVNSFRTGNYQQAIESLNTRSLTLGDYAANRVGQFINGVSRSMRNGLLAGKYIYNGRYLGINNISQPFIMATTTPNFVGRALQRTLTNIATLGIDPIALTNTLKRAGTALPAGGLATGATIGGLMFGAPIAGGVAGAIAGTALLAKGDLTAVVSRAFENFLMKNPSTRTPLGVFYGANKMDEVYFTDAFGKQWTGSMLNDAIKRNDIYLTQVSYEFGEDAIEDIVKAARVGAQGKGDYTSIAKEALTYLLPNKKSFANILAEETDLAFRQQVFVAGLGMGLPEDQAAALARASLFDYGAINNKLEREYARKFFLFYAFMRQSGLETTKAMLSPNRAAIIGTQARFANNQKKKAELDILLQSTPFATQRRKQLASSYAYVTNAYQQHYYAMYGPAFPMVESYLQLQDMMVNVAKLDIISPALATAAGSSPLTQLASQELVELRSGKSDIAPHGYLRDRDLVAMQGLGLLTKDNLDFFDLEPAEPPSRASFTVAGDVEGLPAEPQLFPEGYRLRFGSKEGQTRYRIMKGIGAVMAIDRSLMDYTSSQVVGDRVVNDEDVKYRQLSDGSYELYYRGLQTPIKVPTYLQMELDILNKQLRDLQGATKGTKQRRKK